MEYAYPPVSFFFEVVFDGQKDAVESRFQSVTGLSVDLQTETLKEGGENRFEHTLPVRSKYTPLVLKRGLVKDSKLVKWCMDAILKFDIQPTNLLVHLLHVKPSNTQASSEPKKPEEKSEPLMTWKVINAWPKKWSVSDFNAEQNAIAIESMELNYSYFEPMNK